MYLTIFIILLLVALIAALIYIRYKESIFLKKNVTQAMRDEMWDDIAKEREEALERGRKFRETLKEEMNKNSR